MTYPGSSWTDERVEMLRGLVADGLSASQIAEEMGGLSRNAVISKIHRSGMVFGSISVGGRPKSGPKPRKHPFVERKRKRGGLSNVTRFLAMRDGTDPGLPVDLPPEPVANPVTLLNLEWWHCRWPLDMPSGPVMYCGAVSAEGKPYCPKHCSDAYHQPYSTTASELERRRRRFMGLRQHKAGAILQALASRDLPNPTELSSDETARTGRDSGAG